jgi:SAM-dependent methyltransferase
MVGVDLSQGMLSHAHRRAVYDELHCRELSTYLDSCAEKFDVVLAADVFCYFGDLRALLMKARGRSLFFGSTADTRIRPRISAARSVKPAWSSSTSAKPRCDLNAAHR